MFNPIEASENIRESFIDYITTSFSFADPVYSKKFRKALQQPDVIAKGPYLELSGSYETGHSLRELIAQGKASPLFETLENTSESEKELKLDRGLYLHQELALEKANAGKSLVVTTGTGSGKTECFLIPIIDALLKEEENGTLNDSVRTILIYPMNALANDQIKRMRSLLKDHPTIRFGLYNGNTPHDRETGLRNYQKLHATDQIRKIDVQPLQNEVLSRREMQERPPHILITNYSMLEHMLLRPKDDMIFSGAQLRYIVLDEAHIYKGATGIETSLLMRRLRARISSADCVQYILTSATLGGKDADDDIVAFAERLCGTHFTAEDIIRSVEKTPPVQDPWEIPFTVFAELAANKRVPNEILRDDGYTMSESEEGPVLYELLLHSNLFHEVRSIAREKGPLTVNEFVKALYNCGFELTDQDFVDFISVCTRAEKGKSALIKARYHFFARALEGAYITLNEPRELFLQRKSHMIYDDESEQEVFECAVCKDCGRLAVVGKTVNDHLVQVKQDDPDAEYYIPHREEEDPLIDEDDESGVNEETGLGENEYAICPICGAIAGEEGRFDPPCPHGYHQYIKVTKVQKKDSGKAKCIACGFGELRRFYIGGDAATAVLGTKLYDLLPETEEKPIPQQSDPKKHDNPFAFAARKTVQEIHKARQFLAFSDSRSEAAFFACYMEKSYDEFLRRRGIWHVMEKCRESGVTVLRVDDFVKRLSRYFLEQRTFRKWDAAEDADLTPESDRNAWIAVLNEMYNARRGTSLPAMGLMSFEYKENEEYGNYFQQFGLSEEEGKALLNLLVMDIVYAGAIKPDFSLTPADREYIFYSQTQKAMVLMKQPDNSQKNRITGWISRKKENGNYYPNNRLKRMVRATGMSEDMAYDWLKSYWENILKGSQNAELVLPTKDFKIRIHGDRELKFYRCKKCGRITSYNCKGMCSFIKCDGTLEEYDPTSDLEHNHYAKLYQDKRMQPLFIKEHTAQLSKDRGIEYQNAFVQHRLNALSSSTTFEMGVDLGTLETVYMRDIPPSPANYVQRAGRAGRSLTSAAFVLTYAKLSSHDFTFYKNPVRMIRGIIQAPVFKIQNQKVINRHIYAVAFSAFFAANEDVYDGDNRSVFLNEDGYDKFKTFLSQHPEHLKTLLQQSIPEEMHEILGIHDFSWINGLIGEQGLLEIAVKDYKETIQLYEKMIEDYKTQGKIIEAGNYTGRLKAFRCSKEDGKVQKSLIDFLVRSNILPKYGFPVDTVELLIDASASDENKSLKLDRDLQLAVAEYAPGAEVVADGKLYKSRYIRKIPSVSSGWETGHFYTCSQCKEPNFTKDEIPSEGRACISCGTNIPKRYWQTTLEPRMGFIAENGNGKEVSMRRRPEREYKSDDYYVGDLQRDVIDSVVYSVQGRQVKIESTANDSLVVVVEDPKYYVCPLCGYAADVKPKTHKNAYGFACRGDQFVQRILSHDFKTDVAKIEFDTAKAASRDTMLSVMYAILEGMVEVLGIERNDIKGTLYKIKGRYSIVLYDAVAGGAGHVRRIVTQDGKVFQKVLAAAYNRVKQCGCATSCYNCLRNYYNQRIHDHLDRNLAIHFLEEWLENIQLFQEHESLELSERQMEVPKIKTEPGRDFEYDVNQIPNWDEGMKNLFLSPEEINWLTSFRHIAKEHGVPAPISDVCVHPGRSNDRIWIDLAWPGSKTALFCAENREAFSALGKYDWRVFIIGDPTIDLLELIHQIQSEEEEE